MIQRFLETKQDMLAFPSLPQEEVGTASYDIDAVIDEFPQAIENAQLARLSIDDRQHDDAEVDLHLSVLVQIVQHHFGVLATLQLDDDPHAVTIAFVADITDSFEALLIRHGRNIGNEARFVDLVRQLSDDQRFAVATDVFRGNLRAQFERAAAAGVIVHDTALAQQQAARWKVGSGRER